MLARGQSVVLEGASAGRAPDVAVETDDALTRREASLRSAAVVCLAGIALVQAIVLPPLFSKGVRFAVLMTATMALCVGLGLALAAAPADAGPRLWRRVAAVGVLVVAAWAATHAFAVPGLADAQGDWRALPGAVSGALAAGCVALAVAAARPTRASLRGLVAAGVVLVALAPAAGALMVALGPGTAGGEAVLAPAAAHAHSLLRDTESNIGYVSGPNGRRFVYNGPRPARQTTFGALAAATAALLFACGAIDRLRRRSVPAPARALGSEAG